MAISNATRLSDFGSGIGTQGAVLQVDNTNNRVGIGTTNPQATLQVGTGVSVYGNSGIVSAITFYGDGSNLEGVSAASTENINTNNIKVSGITTLGTETTVVGSAVTFNASGGTVVGVLTATSFSGSGSNLTGLPGGLGTAIAASGAGANIYYANKVLAIDTNLTTDVPDTSNIAYTQHQDLAVGSGVELVVSDGDQIVADILGLSTSLGASALTGGGGVVRADNFTNRTGGAPTFPDGIKVSAGVVTVSDTTASTSTSTGALVVSGGVGIAGSLHVGENVSIGGTLTYEDVINIDSVGVVTARAGLKVTGGTSYFAGAIAAAGAITGTASTATTATNVTVADESSDTACYPLFVTTNTGNLPPKVGTNLTFNSSSGALTATSFSGDGSSLTGISVGITTEALTTAGATVTLDLTKDDHKITKSGTYTITCTGGVESESHTLRIVNSGISTVGFSTYFLFPSGASPVLPIASGSKSMISFTVHKVGAAGTELFTGASVSFS